jgi:hypothetical protein
MQDAADEIKRLRKTKAYELEIYQTTVEQLMRENEKLRDKVKGGGNGQPVAPLKLEVAHDLDCLFQFQRDGSSSGELASDR